MLMERLYTDNLSPFAESVKKLEGAEVAESSREESSTVNVEDGRLDSSRGAKKQK